MGNNSRMACASSSSKNEFPRRYPGKRRPAATKGRFRESVTKQACSKLVASFDINDMLPETIRDSLGISVRPPVFPKLLVCRAFVGRFLAARSGDGPRCGK